MPSDYSGVLGESALGAVTLGGYESTSVTYARMTQTAAEVLDVYAPGILMTAINFELFYAPTPNSVITQIAVEVMSQKTQSLLLTQQTAEILDQYVPFARMTEIASEVLGTYSPSGRLTNISSEILDVYSPEVRLTQESAEVLYQYIAPEDVYFTTAIAVSQTIAHSSFINRTVVSNIAINQIIAGQVYPKSMTTNVAVAQTIVARNSTIRASVTSNIAVTPTIRVNKDIIRSATSNILLTPTVHINQPIVELSVQSDITVTQTIRENEDIVLSVTSNISVSQTVAIHSSDVDMSVTTNITLLQSIAFRNTVVRISMLQEIGATQTGQQQSDHEFIHDDIGVDCLIIARNTNVRAEIFSTLTLTATIYARSTIIYETVISDITVAPVISFMNPNIAIQSDIIVTQVIATRNTNVSLSLESGITVSQDIRHSPNAQSVTSHVDVDGAGFGTAIKIYINPISYSIIQPVYIRDTIAGGNSNREIAVQSDIIVTPIIRDNFPVASVLSQIAVSQTIAGGNDTREISLQDNIAVSQSIALRNGIITKSIKHSIKLTQTILDQTDDVFASLTHDIIINPTINTRVVPNVRFAHAIEVHQIILARPDNNRQSVIDNITINQVLRSSPNYQTIVQPVMVSSRIRQLFQSIRSEIIVHPKINQERSRLLIHKLPIAQVLTANRVLNRTIRSDITVTPAIKANHDYIRSIITYVPIAEGFYPIRVDFHDQPILVPVATGIIVSATLMSIRGQHGVIVLPAAQLGDAVANIGKVEVRQSMDGTAFSYIQQTDRKKLTYKWLLSHLKMYELRTFVRSSISDLLTMENWKGERWMVKITKNPFEFQNQGVWERDKEFAEVEMTFEGVKIA